MSTVVEALPQAHLAGNIETAYNSIVEHVRELLACAPQATCALVQADGAADVDVVGSLAARAHAGICNANSDDEFPTD